MSCQSNASLTFRSTLPLQEMRKSSPLNEDGDIKAGLTTCLKVTRYERTVKSELAISERRELQDIERPLL